MSHEYWDSFESGESDCCGAAIYLGNICKKCGEHCDTRKEERTSREFSPEQQAFINLAEKEEIEP